MVRATLPIPSVYCTVCTAGLHIYTFSYSLSLTIICSLAMYTRCSRLIKDDAGTAGQQDIQDETLSALYKDPVLTAQ